MFQSTHYISILILIFLACCTNNSQGQELCYVNYGLNSPLQTKTIYDLYIAKNGLLYIATDNGFWSYDGNTFKQYEKQGLRTTDVTNIMELENGNLIFQNFKGEAFQLRKDSLSLVVDKQTVGFTFQTIFIKDDYWYCWNGTKLACRHKDSTQFKIILNNKDVTTGTRLLSREYARAGFLINDLGNATNTIIELNKDSISIIDTVLHNGHITYLGGFKDQYCTLHDAKTNNGIFLNRDKDTIFTLNAYPKKISPIRIRVIDNKTIVCARSGLYLPETNQLFFQGCVVSYIVKDLEGNIWVATTTNGLFKVHNWNYLLYQMDKSNDQRSDFILKHQDKILTTDLSGNFYKWNQEENKLIPFYKTNVTANVKNFFWDDKTVQYISSGSISNLFDSSLNKTFDRQFYNTIYSSSPGKVYLIASNKTIIYGELNWTVRERGRMFHLQDNDWFKYDTLGIEGNRVFVIKDAEYLLKKDSFLVALRQDTLTYINGNNIEDIRHHTLAKGSLKIHHSNQRMWIEFTNMLQEYDLNGQVLNTIPRNNGLAKNISNISIDDKHLAISTKEAIYLYHAQTLEYIHKFTTQNGITSIDFNKAWIYDDKLYVNGSEGISEIPLDGNYNKGQPKLSIKKIQVNGITKNDAELDYTENNIQIDFELLSFTTKSKLYWRFNDKDWRVLEGVPQIRLEGLQHGSYKISAYLQNDLGTKSPMLTYEFHINSPYWLRWWFWVAIGLALSVLAFVFYRMRLRQIHTRNQLKNHLIASQMTALKSQMNPHFIFNALNSIQSLIRFKKNKEAYKYVNKFATLLRQTLNYSDKDFIPLEKEIELLSNYLEMEKMRLDDQLEFSIDSIAEYNISIPSMIIQPFVENAIKHGLLHKKTGNKRVNIQFELQNKQLLLCTITDNGVGREKAQEIKLKQQRRQSSFSTGATQKRLELLQQLQHQKLGVEYIDLKDNFGQAIGTQVKITIPIDTL